MNRSRNKIIKISKELQAEMDAIPRKCSATKITFTPEQDAVLLQLYADKTVQRKDATAFFKSKYGFGVAGTLRLRYKELTA